eukprot:3381900-Pyramimonas_sp.AAC.1
MAHARNEQASSMRRTQNILHQQVPPTDTNSARQKKTGVPRSSDIPNLDNSSEHHSHQSKTCINHARGAYIPRTSTKTYITNTNTSIATSKHA